MANNEEKLEQLLDILAQQSNVLDFSLGKHNKEAVEIKKQFFLNVTNTLESINKVIESHTATIGELQKSIYEIRLNSKMELSALKDFIINELKELRKYHDEDYEKYTEKMDTKLSKLVDKVDSIPGTILDLRNTHTQDSIQFKNDLIKEEIRPLGDKVTNIYIKVMILSSVAGILGSIAFSLLLAFIKR